MSRTAFVTGATGFLGLNLVEQLTAAGWRVVGLHRPGSDTRLLVALGAEPVPGDILDPATLTAALPAGVNALFHTAADTSVWSRHAARQTEVNVTGTRNVLAAARAGGARRLIHVSTWNTFGLEHAAISEETPQTGDRSWINYVRSKSLAEQAVRAAPGLPTVIVNPPHIVGRYDRRNWARTIILTATGKLPGIPPGAGIFVHGAAVAKALIAAAEQGRPGENYLLPGVEADFVEVFRLIGLLTGKPVPARPMPAGLLRLYAKAQVGIAAVIGREPQVTPEGVALVLRHPRIESDKAARELGWRPADLETQFGDAHHWLQAQGLLQ